MAYKIKIKVTREILERSRNCPTGCLAVKSCAFSLAFRDIFPNASVRTNYIDPFDEDRLDSYFETTLEMRRFIRIFDSLQPYERVAMFPQDFELELPDWVIERIGIKEVDRILENSETMEKIKV